MSPRAIATAKDLPPEARASLAGSVVIIGCPPGIDPETWRQLDEAHKRRLAAAKANGEEA